MESEVPTITATTGSITYEPNKTYSVAKGTPVKFTITRYDEVNVTAAVNDVAVESSKINDDGIFEITIEEETMVEVKAGEVSADYYFDLKKPFTPDGWSWKRVVDVSTLRATDKLIIASEEGKVALGNRHTTEPNTVPSIGVSFETDDDNDVYLQFDEIGKSSEPMVLELAASTVNVDNNIPWVLKSTNYTGTDGYLSTTDNNKYELQIVPEEDDLSIEITDGDALIDFNGHTHHILGYNTNLGVFACYDQNAIDDDETDVNKVRHADIQIYRLTDDAADLRVRYTATAADGTKYSPWTVSDVAKGTVVTFGVQFYHGDGAATIKVGDGEAKPLEGNNVLTINEDTTVDVTTDVKKVTFVFKVRNTFTLDNGTEVLYYTVAEALSAISDGVTPTINVKGIVKEVTNFSANYGSITYTIADNAASTDVLTIYGGLGIDGESFEAKTDLEVGAMVIVCGQIFNYQDKTPEMAQNNYQLYYNDGKVSISAFTGDTNYKAGYTIVNSGTKVGFAISNADEILATVNGEEVDFVDGKYTLTVAGKTEVSIVADAASATYIFVPGLPSLAELTPEGHSWIRVDDVATLHDGDMLIVACSLKNLAMSNELQAKNYLHYMEASFNDNLLTWNDGEYQPLVFSLQGNAEGWHLLAMNSTSWPTGGLISGSSSKSDLNIIEAKESNIESCSTKIEIDSNGDAKVSFGGRWISYNVTSPRFGSYNNQTPVQLYRLTAPEPKFHGGMQVGHNYTEGCEGFRVNFSFNVVNHNTDPVHHYISLLDANNNKIEDIIVKDLTDENQMSAPRRVEDELPSNVTKINGLFEISGEGMKTTKPATIAIRSHIGNQNIINAYRALDSDGIQTGIQEVETEGAEAEYYNLQGMRVNQPVAGQLYIKRQGNRVSKVKF